MNFRRYYVPGRAVFITQVVQNRIQLFIDPDVISLLRKIIMNVKKIHPFELLGYVYLPDHFHIIVQPTGESNFSDIMHSLKPVFTKEYKHMIGLAESQTLKLWQKRFWDHVIRNDRDLENHLHYMHFNPVKHGYVKKPGDWENSSYFEWEERGLYPVPFTWEEPANFEWGE